MTAPTTSIEKTGRSLVSPALFERLTARVAAEHVDLADDMPARIIDQALAFLATCATSTRPLGPSNTVDIGWHTFLMYTHEYAEFCDRIAGRFIHHNPEDGSEWPTDPTSRPTSTDTAAVSVTSGPVPLARATAAMEAAGYRVDWPLWQVNAADCNSKCTQCHAGCHDSPTR